MIGLLCLFDAAPNLSEELNSLFDAEPILREDQIIQTFECPQRIEE